MMRARSMRVWAACAVVGAACPGALARPGATITNLGQLGDPLTSDVTCGAMSPDGSTVTGYSTTLDGKIHAFRWRQGTPMADLGTLDGTVDSYGYAINADGSQIAGVAFTSNSVASGLPISYAFRWTSADGLHQLGTLAGFNAYDALGMSGTGDFVVGQDEGQALRWNAAGTASGLGVLAGQAGAQATAVSADGSVVIGYSGNRAFRWTQAGGMVSLGTIPGYDTFRAYAMNSDGSVVIGGAYVGTTAGTVFKWTAANGMVNVGVPSGHVMDTGTALFAMSGDGLTFASSALSLSRSRQVSLIYTPGNVVDEITYFTNAGVGFSSWGLKNVTAISQDGRTMAGTGVYNGPYSRAYIVRNLPAVTRPCNPADIVSVGQSPPPDGLLTGDDYVAFINAFFTGSHLADIVSVGQQPPADGLLTGDDYVAFINNFFVGCR